jgi:hypothetical protein
LLRCTASSVWVSGGAEPTCATYTER